MSIKVSNFTKFTFIVMKINVLFKQTTFKTVKIKCFTPIKNL